MTSSPKWIKLILSYYCIPFAITCKWYSSFLYFWHNVHKSLQLLIWMCQDCGFSLIVEYFTYCHRSHVYDVSRKSVISLRFSEINIIKRHAVCISFWKKSAWETCYFFSLKWQNLKLLKNITYNHLFKMPKHLQYTLYKNYTQKLNNHQI